MSPDGRGFAKLFITTTASGTFEVDTDFVLTSNSHAAVIRYDSMEPAVAPLTCNRPPLLALPPYAFSLSGSDNSNNPLATVGS